MVIAVHNISEFFE